MEEEKVLEEILEIENRKIAVSLFNFYREIDGIKKDMVDSLNLLDEIAEGSVNKKDLLRKKILDNFNNLPRETLKMINKLNKQLKE